MLSAGNRNNPNVDLAPSRIEFVEDYVFHRVRGLDIAKVKPGISQARVDTVVFQRIVEILLAFYLPPFCFIEKKSVLKVFDVVGDRMVAWGCFQDGLDGVFELVRIRERSRRRRKHVNKPRKHIVIP